MIARYGGLVAEIGWSAERHDEQWRVSEIAPSGPAQGRLEHDDVVLAVDGDERAGSIGPFSDFLQLYHLRFHPVTPVGGTYAVRVARGQRVLEMEVPLLVHQDPGLLARSLSLLAASLAFYVVGTLVGLLRPRDRMPQMLVYPSLGTALVLLAIALIPIIQFAHGHERYLLLAILFIYPFHLLLGYRFLHQLVVMGEQTQPFWAYLERGLWSGGFIVFIPRIIVLPINVTDFTATMDWASNHTLLYSRISAFASASQLLFDPIVGLAMCAVLIVNYPRVSDVDQRRRLKWIVYGTAAGMMPLALVSLAGDLLQRGIIPIATIFTILIPITFAYAIARYRVLGVQVVVRRGIQYLLARNFLRVVLALPVLGFIYTVISNPEKTVGELLFGRSAYVYGLLLASGGLSLRYRQRLTEWLDRRFFREAYDQERILVALIESVKSSNSLREISRLVCDQVALALHPVVIYLYYRQNEGGRLDLGYSSGGGAGALSIPDDFETIALMEHRVDWFEISPQRESRLPVSEERWFRSLGVNLIIPMRGAEMRLRGLLLLGDKKSEEAYGPNDRRLLQAVAAQAAVVCENLLLKERIQRERQIRHDVLDHLQERGIDLLKECRVCGKCFDGSDQFCPDDRAELAPTLPIERTINGRYRLEQALGKGGMGAVYRAQDLRLRRAVAVKVLLGSFFGDRDALRRFEREAHSAARLNHPNIVAVYDYGVTGPSGAYLVMELLQGSSWRAEISRSGVLYPKVAADWTEQVLDGLETAHKFGIVHRDLKPENLMLSLGADGRVSVKILDFGLAKEVTQQSGSQTVGSNVTAPGTVLGTYTYMAPEQLSGKPVDARADLFALGVIVAESLTGSRPFKGKTLAELIRSLLHDDFQLPGDSPEIRRLNAALLRALAKDSQNRFSSAEEMRRELIPALRACASLPSAQEKGVIVDSHEWH